MFFQRGKSNQVIYYLIAAFILILCVEGLVIAAKKGDNKNNSASFKLPVWIQGNGKLPKWELTLDEFKIIQGKSLLEATSLKKPESPTMLFIAFDTVGEVANISEVRSAVTHEIQELGSLYWVGLISANEQISVVQEPTPDREVLSQKIEQLSQIGKAGLLDTLIPLADFTTGILLKSDVRVAVIFITDSDIGNYKTDYLNAPINVSDSRDLSRRFAGRALQEKISRMSKAIAKFQVPIFIVHIAPGQDPLNRAYQNGLKQLAEVGGGKCLLSKSISDIPPTVHDAFEWARSFYLLSFRLAAPKGSYSDVMIKLAPKEPDSDSVGTIRLIYPNRVYVP